MWILGPKGGLLNLAHVTQIEATGQEIRVWRLGGDGPDTLEYDSPAEAEALLATIVAHLTEQSNLLDLTGGRGGSAP